MYKNFPQPYFTYFMEDLPSALCDVEALFTRINIEGLYYVINMKALPISLLC